VCLGNKGLDALNRFVENTCDSSYKQMQTENAKLKEGIREDYSELREELPV
jgi:hypothetical protein